jgi:hypothetical protein
MPVVLQSSGDSALGPLLPEVYDVVWWLIIAAFVLLVAAALVRIVRSRELSTSSRFIWVLLVLLTPPVGAVAALLLVRSVRSSVKLESS